YPLPSRVLLVDTVGELGHWWGTAHIAFVGGSLTRRGGQNMIEPAAYGAAVSFGPNTWNFRDVVSLMLERDAAIVVRGEQELEAFVRRCLLDPTFADELGARAQQLVIQQQGAADRTIKLMERLMTSKTQSELVDRAA
ncbi:MAG: 3-deoxy-D-manno-octulosonic acid transferase, partial [Planctomycetia bacterium]|nr:3-deoxy-D-manno-octulosonic acid transferase [Planctomycetia bacterium]